MNLPCFLSLPMKALTKASSDQVSRFSSDICKNILEKGRVGDIPGPAFRGFTAECFELWNPKACATLEGYKFAELDVKVIQEVSKPCALNLPNSAMSIVSKGQVEVFNKNICESLTSNLAYSFDHQSFAGFTADCVEEWQPSFCACAPPHGFHHLTIDAFGALQGNCISQLNSGFQNTTAAQIHALQPLSCEAINANLFSDIPNVAYAGFSGECVQKWSTPSCFSITGEGLSQLNSDYIKDITDDCLMSIKPDEITKLGKAFSEAMPDAFCGVLTPLQLNKVSNQFMGGVSCSCAAKFSHCHAFIQLQFGSFQSLSCVSDECFEDIPSEAFVWVDYRAISKLPKRLCKLISPQKITAMTNDDYELISSDCASSLQNNTCAVFGRNAILNHMTPAAIGALTTDCIHHVDTHSFQELTSTALMSFTTEQCHTVDTINFNALPPSAMVGFTPQCASAFDATMCSNVTASFIGNIPVKSFSNLKNDCVGTFTSKKIGVLSLEQVLATSPESFQTFCQHNDHLYIILLSFPSLPDLISPLQAHAIANQMTCWERLNIHFAAGELIGGNNFDAGYSNLAMSFVKDNGFKNVTQEQISHLTLDQIVGLREAHAHSLSFKQLSAMSMTHAFFLSLQPDFLLGINDKRIQAIQGVSFSYISKNFNYVSLSAIPHLSKEQIALMTPNFALCREQIVHFTTQQISWMLPATRATLDIVHREGPACPKSLYFSSSSSSSGSSSLPDAPASNDGASVILFATVLLTLIAFGVLVPIRSGYCSNDRRTSQFQQPLIPSGNSYVSFYGDDGRMSRQSGSIHGSFGSAVTRVKLDLVSPTFEQVYKMQSEQAEQQLTKSQPSQDSDSDSSSNFPTQSLPSTLLTSSSSGVNGQMNSQMMLQQSLRSMNSSTNSNSNSSSNNINNNNNKATMNILNGNSQQLRFSPIHHSHQRTSSSRVGRLSQLSSVMAELDSNNTDSEDDHHNVVMLTGSGYQRDNYGQPPLYAHIPSQLRSTSGISSTSSPHRQHRSNRRKSAAAIVTSNNTTQQQQQLLQRSILLQQQEQQQKESGASLEKEEKEQQQPLQKITLVGSNTIRTELSTNSSASSVFHMSNTSNTIDS
eukprot:TRINITY_DN618_c0_g8_i1.p1 TRINITY_DN618_c0_g8~~TRINITY_DN618_c0_g8_i1.p1  ORF type:complete len:1145 (-),score=245.89 TRINITY_DN618_c0_g8_i1:116-3424(-)